MKCETSVYKFFVDECPVVPTPLVRRFFFLSRISLPLCERSRNENCKALFLGSLFCLLYHNKKMVALRGEKKKKCIV